MKPLLLAILTVILALALAKIYTIWEIVAEAPWLTAAIINTILAAIVLIRLRIVAAPSVKPDSWQLFGRDIPAKAAFLPPLFMVLFPITAAMISREFGVSGSSSSSVKHLIYFVIWIPIIEEVVFRVGFGSFFRRIGGMLWGSYFSALLFACVHTFPSFEKIARGEFGILMGPFILGLVCEYIYAKTNRMLPIILLHAAANLSGILFLMLDSRWLDWLDFLFINH